MANQFDLASLKEIFADKSSHIAIASIVKISLAQDRSCLHCLVSVYPEQREMVAKMTWESVGPDSGIFQFPSPRDMVLIAYADRDVDQCFVIRRLTSKEDRIPMQAVDGDTCVIALADKKVWITSDSKIFLSKGTGEPAEPLVLGNQLKNLLSVVLQKIGELNQKLSTHTHAGNLGYPTSAPNEAADFVTLKEFFDGKKESPVDDALILSDLAFTEKGS